MKKLNRNVMNDPQDQHTRIKNASESLGKTIDVFKKAKEKTAMLSPSETADMLEDAIGVLTNIVGQLHDMGGSPEGGEAASAPKPVPSNDEEDKEMLAMKHKMASLEESLNKVSKVLQDEAREKLANEYSKLFANQEVATTKRDEILKSTDPLPTLQARVKEATEMKSQFTGSAKERQASRNPPPIHKDGTGKQKDASSGQAVQPAALDFTRL